MIVRFNPNTYRQNGVIVQSELIEKINVLGNLQLISLNFLVSRLFNSKSCIFVSASQDTGSWSSVLWTMILHNSSLFLPSSSRPQYLLLTPDVDLVTIIRFDPNVYKHNGAIVRIHANLLQSVVDEWFAWESIVEEQNVGVKGEIIRDSSPAEGAKTGIKQYRTEIKRRIPIRLIHVLSHNRK